MAIKEMLNRHLLEVVQRELEGSLNLGKGQLCVAALDELLGLKSSPLLSSVWLLTCIREDLIWCRNNG